MGLDTSHDAWHGPYSSFSEWRRKIGELAGLTYSEKTQGTYTYQSANIDWLNLPLDQDLQGHWTQEPKDPILYLIAHSDADGELSPYRCARLADRLTGLLPKIQQDPKYAGMPGWSTLDRTEQFIKGLQLAASRGETLEFH